MLDPELKPFLDEWQRQWAKIAPNATPQQRREHFEVIAAEMRLPTPDGVSTDRVEWIDTPVGAVRVRVFRHDDDAAQPCLIYMHGGAWMQGSPETHWDITARIAAFNRQTVISVDYALAPEHPFPAAIVQVGAVVEWAFANAGDLGIDPARIAIGGDSAGGNLAAATALKFRGSECPLHAQLLIYPAVEFEQARPSFTENADGPLLTTAGMPAVNAMYMPNEADRVDPLAAPLKAKDHSGLPPAFVAVAEHDPLRDDGIAYAQALEAAGVPVELHRGTGLIHGYLRAMEYCAASRAALKAMCAWLDARNRT
jgi:acetyl esterase/lipase